MLFLAEKCPECKKRGQKVETDTMIHHVKDISRMDNSTYFFCDSPDCDVVYYHSNSIFTTDMVNKEIGLKDASGENGILCYCYNYTKASLDDDTLTDKINIRIDNYGERCDIRHPAGRCCLKDIKKIRKEQKEKIRENGQKEKA